MPRVVHFEIHADDPQRAAKFYHDVFDWQVNKWEGPQDYWLVTTGSSSEPGIDGAILQRMQPINGDSVTAYVCTVDVPSVDNASANITAQGGTIVLPKMASLSQPRLTSNCQLPPLHSQQSCINHLIVNHNRP